MVEGKEEFYWDRPLLSILRFPFYYCFAMPILALLNGVLFGLRIEGRRNLKNLKQAILVCNHTHYLDSTMMALAVYPRQIVFFSQRSNFNLPLARWILKIMGCYPIGSNYTEIKRFQTIAVEKARRGVWLGIFPEGNMSIFNPNLQPFKKGAFWIACQSGAPIVPLVIARRPDHSLWHRITKLPALTLKIHPPVYALPDMKMQPAMECLRDETYGIMANLMK
jgi:1-acyl-sn-glycerol-3-phosphate acyltransferase